MVVQWSTWVAACTLTLLIGCAERKPGLLSAVSGIEEATPSSDAAGGAGAGAMPGAIPGDSTPVAGAGPGSDDRMGDDRAGGAPGDPTQPDSGDDGLTPGAEPPTPGDPSDMPPDSDSPSDGATDGGTPDPSDGGDGPGDVDPSVPCDDGAPAFSDVEALLKTHCTRCHGASPERGLDLRTHDRILASGVVKPGSCEDSLLYRKTGNNPPSGSRMPLGRSSLSEAERDLLCRWIDNGAKSCNPPNTPEPPAVGRDNEAPEFAGLTSAIGSDGACRLEWPPATDDRTASSDITYQVFITPPGLPFPPVPFGEVLPGRTVVVVPAPLPRFDVVVLAVDEAGNRDDNFRRKTCDTEG